MGKVLLLPYCGRALRDDGKELAGGSFKHPSQWRLQLQQRCKPTPPSPPPLAHPDAPGEKKLKHRD